MTSIETKSKTEQPGIASVILILGYVIIVCGFVAGCLLGKVEVEGIYKTYSKFSFASALIYWSAGLVGGVLLIGLAKIIELLTVIANKDYILIKEDDNNALKSISDTVAESLSKESEREMITENTNDENL